MADEPKKDPPPRNIVGSHATIGEAYRKLGAEPVYQPTQASTPSPSPLSEPCNLCKITWDGKLKVNMRECTHKCVGG